MEDEKLVRMANQIAGYFKSYPDADAAAGISEHIKSFWSAKMQRILTDRIARDRNGIEPLVIQGMADPLVLAAFIDRDPGTSPILKAVEGPGGLGQITSDAG